MTLSSPLGSGVYQVWQHTLPSPGQTCRWVGSCGCAQRTEVDLQNLWKQRTHSAVSLPLRLPLSCGRVGGHEYQDVVGSEKSWNLIVDEPAVQRGNAQNSHLKTAAKGTATKSSRYSWVNPRPEPAGFDSDIALQRFSDTNAVDVKCELFRHFYGNLPRTTRFPEWIKCSFVSTVQRVSHFHLWFLWSFCRHSFRGNC